MPRGLSDTYEDQLAKIVQQISQAKMASNANMEFLAQLEAMLLEEMKGGAADELGASAAEAGMGPMMGPEPSPLGGAAGGPTPTAESPTRLPRGGGNAEDPAAEIQRMLAGS